MTPSRDTAAARRAIGAVAGRVLACAAAAMFVVYCAWVIAWLSRGQLPPAIIKALTGLPAPTTGGTRSVMALCRGDWALSLAYNPMTLPLLLLLGASLAALAVRAVHRQPLRLSPGLAWGWLILLSIAWALKLLGPRAYW